MRKSQLIALILVAIIAVAVIPAAAVAQLQSNPEPKAPSIVGATRTPTLTVGWTPTYPKRGQSFIVWERLTWKSGAGTTYQLPNKPIWIYWKYPWEYTWHYYTKKYTSPTGYVQSNDNEGPRAIQYLLKFPGDSVYLPVSKQVTVWIGKTTTSAYTSNYKPTQGQQFKIYGWVKDAYGNGIVGAPMQVWYQTWDPVTGYSDWATFPTTTPITTTGGYWEKSSLLTPHWVQFVVRFQGYPTGTMTQYWESSATTPWIDGT